MNVYNEQKIIGKDLLDHVHDLLVLVEPKVMVGDGHPLEGDLLGVLEEGVRSPDVLRRKHIRRVHALRQPIRRS
jgi:hypothetical protein